MPLCREQHVACELQVEWISTSQTLINNHVCVAFRDIPKIVHFRKFEVLTAELLKTFKPIWNVMLCRQVSSRGFDSNITFFFSVSQKSSSGNIGYIRAEGKKRVGGKPVGMVVLRTLWDLGVLAGLLG